jgi:DNA polymerase III subunit delta'
MTPAWLEPALHSLSTAFRDAHMPHALLIHEAPGSGGDWLARWVARLLLCSNRPSAPCDSCASCKRVLAMQHPDLQWVTFDADSRQLRIEQVRELSTELALTSHQGGYKIGVLSPADGLNRFAANALLKTLEEPAPKTLLILVAVEPSRLPATILSRCQRIRIRAPARGAAVEWLRATKGEGDWSAVLDVLGEAPFLAAESDPTLVPRLSAEMRGTLEELCRGAADPVATAERWSRAELPLRLRCFENWLTDGIRALAEVHLPRPAPPVKLRGLFELVDGVRELKSALDAPLNKSLALESLLRRLAPSKG